MGKGTFGAEDSLKVRLRQTAVIEKTKTNRYNVVINQRNERQVNCMATSQDTVQFRRIREDVQTPEQILRHVFMALNEKGYDPINQIVGYLVSGDPTFITSYNDARSLIIRVPRDELLEELVSAYMKRV